jgi:hypothetical protein
VTLSWDEMPRSSSMTHSVWLARWVRVRRSFIHSPVAEVDAVLATTTHKAVSATT